MVGGCEVAVGLADRGCGLTGAIVPVLAQSWTALASGQAEALHGWLLREVVTTDLGNVICPTPSKFLSRPNTATMRLSSRNSVLRLQAARSKGVPFRIGLVESPARAAICWLSLHCLVGPGIPAVPEIGLTSTRAAVGSGLLSPLLGRIPTLSRVSISLRRTHFHGAPPPSTRLGLPPRGRPATLSDSNSRQV